MSAEGLPIQVACRVLAVSESGYHAWRTRAPSLRAVRHALLTDLIIEIHASSRGVYGARRIHAELTLGRGVQVSHGAVELLMRRAGIQGVTGKPRFRRIANVATASDRVERSFGRSERDQLWVTDITEHPTREGKVYCAVVLDAWSRRVVGWSIDSTPSAALATNALGMAIDQRRPASESDRDSLGPGHAVHVVGVHPPRRRLGPVALDGFGRGLLRQRHDRVVLEPHAGRAPEPSAMAHPHRAGERDLRVPRGVPQPPAPTLGAWHAHTRRVRSSTRTNDSSLKNQTIGLYRTRGTPEPPTNPGRFSPSVPLRLVESIFTRPSSTRCRSTL